VSLVRYVLAWILVVMLPPAILYWFAVHPFAAFWRRVGRWAGLSAAFATLFASAIGLALLAPHLLVTEYGFSWPLTAVALVLIAGAFVIQRRRKKYLTFRVLMGVPELAQEPSESRLFTEGIYARIRHPRYVEVVLATTGYALVANYLAAYVVLAISIGLIWLLVLIEERELHARFGRAWEEYAARTPRFVPRPRG
jgi:protein-S-isoprenylcysteine O-methyltransferase Ste14